MKTITFFPLFVCALLLTGTSGMLAGCAAFSTGASMRVEVEVYKGPLSKEPEIQLGEIFGLIGELCDSLGTYDLALFNLAESQVKESRKGEIPPLNRRNCEKSQKAELVQELAGQAVDNLGSSLDSWCKPFKRDWSPEQLETCTVAAQLHDQVTQLQRSALAVIPTAEFLYATSTSGVDRGQVGGIAKAPKIVLTKDAREAATAAAKLATQLKLKSMYRVESDAISRPRLRSIRLLSTGFINLTSEYANQIGSRADAWLKQAVTPSKYVQQSVYLRDSAPTDAVNLYVWNRAAAPALLQDMLLEPIGSTITTEEVTSRVRGIERIFADGYWSNINTVYASGQGDVSMALVKDDIGNWNLKSFSTDPTKLLQAYRDAGIGLIGQAAKLAAGTGTLSAGKKVLEFANSLALGSSDHGNSGNTVPIVENMREWTRVRIQRVSADLNDGRNGMTEALALQYVRRILDDYEVAIKEMAASANGSGTGDVAAPASKLQASMKDSPQAVLKNVIGQ